MAATQLARVLSTIRSKLCGPNLESCASHVHVLGSALIILENAGGMVLEVLIERLGREFDRIGIGNHRQEPKMLSLVMIDGNFCVQCTIRAHALLSNNRVSRANRNSLRKLVRHDINNDIADINHCCVHVRMALCRHVSSVSKDLSVPI